LAQQPKKKMSGKKKGRLVPGKMRKELQGGGIRRGFWVSKIRSRIRFEGGDKFSKGKVRGKLSARENSGLTKRKETSEAMGARKKQQPYYRFWTPLSRVQVRNIASEKIFRKEGGECFD